VEVRLFEPAVSEHHAFQFRLSEAGEVGPALGEDDVVPRRFGQLDAGQPAEVELHAAQRGLQGTGVRKVAVLEPRVDGVVEAGRRIGVRIEVGRVRRLQRRHG
jgi:hypothetical protein